MALDEGHVELFKVCGWIELDSVQSNDELGVWAQSLEWLCNVAHYRAGHSVKLGSRNQSCKFETLLQVNQNLLVLAYK